MTPTTHSPLNPDPSREQAVTSNDRLRDLLEQATDCVTRAGVQVDNVTVTIGDDGDSSITLGIDGSLDGTGWARGMDAACRLHLHQGAQGAHWTEWTDDHNDPTVSVVACQPYDPPLHRRFLAHRAAPAALLAVSAAAGAALTLAAGRIARVTR